MLEFDGGRFLYAFNRIATFAQTMISWDRQNLKSGQVTWPLLAHRDLHELAELAGELGSKSAELGMGASAMLAAAFCSEIGKLEESEPGKIALENGSFHRTLGAAVRLQEGVLAEANTKHFLALDSAGERMWTPLEPLFGIAVHDSFSTARPDIEEAGKCLALGRATAAIFHLMRAMESAVQVLGVKLGATVMDAKGEMLPWGVILANIKPKIDALPKGSSQDEWYKVHALLHSVNRAFRTKTAHPADNYTEEEAHNAFVATKTFLQEMAERA